VDADEDGDTILGYLDSGLGGDLLRSSGAHRREERPAEKEQDRRWAARLSKEEGDEG
jgi:hypothetical protein